MLLHDRIALSKEQVAYYSDPRTRDIFCFTDRVAACVAAHIARTAVDVNRSPLHLPPAYPDGVIKSMTVDKIPVYRDGAFPDEPLIVELLLRYFFPFHIRVNHALESGTVRIAFDCHSMLPENPPTNKEPGKERPLVCLSNGGDRQARPIAGKPPVTCPPEWMEILRNRFAEAFGDGSVAFNNPFSGGFISRYHFRRHRIPWVQVELNRVLYEADGGSAGPERVAELHQAVFGALSGFWDEIAPLESG
ncbi:MAG: N-formylglutamate amidohydrolase [Methanomicrobiales archaeon]|nr:N-formylglutamate amidohydrolase [Methanomicrobiales archaeon]